MLVSLSQAVGDYLLNVFFVRPDWGVLVGYIGQALFGMRFIVQWVASERAGRSDPDRDLVLFDRGRRGVARLRPLQARPGVHHRPGTRSVRLFTQSLFCISGAQDGPGGKMIQVFSGRALSGVAGGSVKE